MTTHPLTDGVFPHSLSPPRVLAANIGFTEGPIWTGESIIVTSITRGLLYRMSLQGNDVVPVTETGGGPNGLTYDHVTGRVWIAQNGRVHMPPRASVPDRVAGIQSWAPEEGVATHHENPRSAPNDCVIGPDGRLWFTSPAGDPHEGTPVTGSVCAMDMSTGDIETLWHTDGYPNGLAFGVTPDRFYLAETRYARVVEFENSAGTLRPTGRSAELPHGYPDGIAFAATGHLLVAGTSSGRLEVFDPGLQHCGGVDFGANAMPTNVCFAGTDLHHIVVTLAKDGRVIAMESDLPGLALTGVIGQPNGVEHQR